MYYRKKCSSKLLKSGRANKCRVSRLSTHILSQMGISSHFLWKTEIQVFSANLKVQHVPCLPVLALFMPFLNFDP